MRCKLCGDNGCAACMPERMEMPGTVEGYEAGEREYARDLFACGAMEALIGIPGGPLALEEADGYARLAQSAYGIADAMMAERDKRRAPAERGNPDFEGFGGDRG